MLALAAAVAAMMAFAIGLLPSIPLVRLLFAAPFLLFLPGYAVLCAMFPDRWHGLEAFTLSSGLSIAMTVLCGLLLHCFGGLTPLSWSIALGGITLLGFAYAPAQSLPSISLPAVAEYVRSLDPRQIKFLTTAALISMAALVVAREGALLHRPFPVTQLWMVPNRDDASLGYTIGIANQEDVPASYDVEVRLDGRLIAAWNGITLRRAESWTADVPLSLETATRKRAEAWLFKDGRRDIIYRKVWAEAKPAYSGQTIARATDRTMVPKRHPIYLAPGARPAGTQAAEN